jgi:F-type H+-transporting ATPase subunit b
MLSRLVRPVPSALGNLGQLSALQSAQVVSVRFAATSPATAEVTTPTTTTRTRPTIAEVLRSNAVMKIPEGPERDLVNFPRPKRLIDPPATSWGFLPEHYFKFFYPKLGATGGWTFGLGFVTYLFSKEIWVMEHEFWNGTGILFFVIYGVKKFGPAVSEYLGNEVQKQMDDLNEGKFAKIDAHKQGVEDEKLAQWQGESYTMLCNANRDNIAFQLEATYRERLMNVYSEVKRRLDYQLAKQDVERNVQQKHMVNWIISKVTKSITAESEQETMKKCLADLKLLAVRA